MKNIIILLACFLVFELEKAGGTNRLYLTDEGQLSEYFSDAGQVVNPMAVEAAKKTRESLPAEDFPEGNWGAAEGGFQLSLRFEKLSFTNGEPIVATLLMRNVTNESSYLSFELIPVGYMDGPIGFKITSSDGSEIMQHDYVPGVSPDNGTKWLAPGTQVKYLEHLDQRFSLTNGVYAIQAIKVAQYGPAPTFENHRPVFKPLEFKNVEVKSAEVKITIKDVR